MADLPMRKPGQHVGSNEHIASTGTGTSSDPFIVKIQVGDATGSVAVIRNGNDLSVSDPITNELLSGMYTELRMQTELMRHAYDYNITEGDLEC